MANEPSVAQVITACLARHGVHIVFSQSLPTAVRLAAADAGIRPVDHAQRACGCRGIAIRRGR